MSDLFLRELLVDVAEKLAGASEEAELVVRQTDSLVDLLADETHGANQVCQLEELETFWPHALREGNARAETRREGVTEEIRHRRLSAIVVDLHDIRRGEYILALHEEVVELRLKTLDDLPRRGGELLVDNQAMETESTCSSFLLPFNAIQLFNTNGGNRFPPSEAKVLLRITFDSTVR